MPPYSTMLMFFKAEGNIRPRRLEMGRTSDYDMPPKPKVWAGSPNECRTFRRTSAECCVLGWNIFYWWAH